MDEAIAEKRKQAQEKVDCRIRELQRVQAETVRKQIEEKAEMEKLCVFENWSRPSSPWMENVNRSAAC